MTPLPQSAPMGLGPLNLEPCQPVSGEICRLLAPVRLSPNEENRQMGMDYPVSRFRCLALRAMWSGFAGDAVSVTVEVVDVPSDHAEVAEANVAAVQIVLHDGYTCSGVVGIAAATVSTTSVTT